MTVVRSSHEDLAAVFESAGGRDVPVHYGRPDTAVRAVRNGVGVIELPYGVVTVEGEDRVEFVDNAVSNAVPAADGEGCYALLLDPQGGVRADLYVYAAADRLLAFVPPERAGEIAAEWGERTFVQDVTVDDATGEFGVFGVHGPSATEKVASVLNAASTPEERLSFVRGRIADEGVTVIRTDAPAGEEGFEVVCAAEAAPAVFDALLNYGLNAAPFGRRSWETLALEAGTPLFETELAGELPNVLGIRNALDFEKGCYVGQEVVSRVENRGRPSRRLVGLRPEALPDADADPAADSDAGSVLPDAAVVDPNGDEVGTVTRAATSPTLDAPIAFALVEYDAAPAGVTVDGETIPAAPAGLPFVEGSERSARMPTYPEAEE